MPKSEPRPLHLHTLESLTADLVSGRAVEIGAGKRFALPDDRARSALEWYRKRGAAEWTTNVTAQLGEELVDAILQKPPDLLALPARPANANNRRLRLKKLEAHRFAGVHKTGTPGGAPENYSHAFTSALTRFEGRNGSGKTSLLNTIIWALTGEMLRPQREPEVPEDFNCSVIAGDADGEPTTHRLSPLTPMPNVEQYRPDRAWVPADTWVELTFVDEYGTELPTIRRSESRSPQGKLIKTSPDLSVLGVDPVAVRIGTVMPGLLPLIKVGSESELGRAVSQLTGLSALVDLADHVRRAKSRIDKEFVKAKTGEHDRADRDYGTAKGDLEKILLAHPNLKPERAIPQPSDDKGIEHILDEVRRHFEAAKATAFESARGILGKHFDPANPALLADLEKNINRALERVSQPEHLASAARLGALRQLKPDQLDAADGKIREILAEARTLDAVTDRSIGGKPRRRSGRRCGN